MKPTALIAALCLGIGLSACSSQIEDSPAASDESEVRLDGFYGNDRVGAMLKGHPDKIPATLPDFEKLFHVGRECARVDSKEVFVVEESQTRLQLGGPEEKLHDVTKTKLMPRAVITGCNTGDLSDPATVKASYSLMAALISDPNMKGSDGGDTMRMWPLEVMALDEVTGLYNFYVFEPAVTPADVWAPIQAGLPGKVTQVFRAKEDRPGHAGLGEIKVFQTKLQAGKPQTEVVQPVGGGNRCFNCHVNGGPLMNELRDPWTNWVSFKKSLPQSSLGGVTQTLVSEAVPSTMTSRSSLANDLEPIMRAATQRYVQGKGGTSKSGWAGKTLEGALPGGLSHMMESVFCETELNYASASQTLPLESFFDPDEAALAGIVPPASFGEDRVPFQMPIRSVRDHETERWLVDRGYLSQSDVVAIRLIDDENDIFSKVRCGLLPVVREGLPAAPAAVGKHVREALKGKLAGMPWAATQPKRKAYVDALLTPGIRREQVQRAYFGELLGRFEQMDKSLDGVKKRERARKTLARAMFSGQSSPLPILELPR